MKVALRAGAEVELLTERELRKALEELRRGIDASLRLVPTAMHPQDAQTVNAAGAAVLDLGVPPRGFEWDVRRVVVTGEDPTVAVAGSGVLHVGAPGSPNPFTVVDFVQAASGFPSVAFYDPEQVVVGNGAHLLFVVAGVVAGTRMFASAYVLERSSKQEQTPIEVAPDVVTENGKVNA